MTDDAATPPPGGDEGVEGGFDAGRLQGNVGKTVQMQFQQPQFEQFVH